MEHTQAKDMQEKDMQKEKLHKVCFWILLLLLAVYPLRHIWLGVELTDSAYSAGNYRFSDQINSMWFFSTYLANVTGQFLSGLPGGNTMMGLNAYSALFISVIAVAMYWFYTKIIKLPMGIAFLAELLSISLCWCPTTILYNYMTYFFFNLTVICLYLGLIREKRILLFGAGVLLGMNVLVRFPNLAEAALILAVWYYGMLMHKRLKDVLQETGICILGFFAGIGGILIGISVKYGLDQYMDGIIKLLNMPSDASDYSLYSMVITVLMDYKASSRWLICMLVLVLVGTLISVAGYRIYMGITKDEEGDIPGWVRIIGAVAFLAGIAVLFRWWYSLGVFNVKYYTYESMFQWVAVFLILTILIALFALFSKKCTRNQKLLSLMVLVLLGVTPLGSNNHLYPNMNNMFLVFGYTFYMLWVLFQNTWMYREMSAGSFIFSLYPARAMLGMFLAVMCLQCLLFGAVFTFRDGMSGQKRDTKIENNAILKGMVTNQELAVSIEELTAYMEQEQLTERGLILYGQIPATSYFLDMPSAISTTWPDLRSYGYDIMVADMEALERGMVESTQEAGVQNAGSQDAGSQDESMQAPRPVIILGAGLDAFLRSDEQGMADAELTESEKAAYLTDRKLLLITEFIEKYDYKRDFGNAKFAVYR